MIVTLPPGPRREFADPLHLAADLALAGRVPVIAVPQEAKSFPVTGRAMVAWEGSQEASAALRLSVPLLKLAEEGNVVTVEEAGKYHFPAPEAGKRVV